MPRILLHSHLMLGDTLMCTCGIRDLKKDHPEYEIMVNTSHMRVWDNNPYLSDFTKPDEEYNIGPKIVTQGSKTNGQHFATAFRVCLEEKLGIKIKQGEFKPDIHLSDAEKNRRLIQKKYWLINIDCGPYNSKRWDNNRWQEIVNKLYWITFVQVGLSKDSKYKLKGHNVIDYIGKTQDYYNGLRDLLSLYYHCEGSIGLVSSQMHLAAAFDKPCVTVAGAREPVTFESYQNHRFLHNIGTLPCAKRYACWRCKLDACKNRVLGDGLPKCMDMVKSYHVIDAIQSYYEGGVLEKDDARNIDKVIPKPQSIFRLVCNAHVWGGAEMSCVQIAKMMGDRGFKVEIATRKHINSEFKKRVPFAEFTEKVTAPCDILMLYASDMVFDFNREEFEVFNKVQAKKRVMALTYKIGKMGEVKWTVGWDKYLFLCSDMREKFRNKLRSKLPTYVSSDDREIVLPPPIDLEPFLKTELNLENQWTHLVRHSSQGNSKYPPIINNIIEQCKETTFSFMPAPSFLINNLRVNKYTYNQMPVHEFLRKGNCFWYILPEGYTDQGPRVIMEAMAVGLPVIAENRDGAKDRVTPETGWLLNSHEEFAELIHSLHPGECVEKGKVAKHRAATEFKKERWVNKIIG